MWLIGALVVTFLVQVSVYAARPTVSYLALQLGADGHTLGAVVAAYALLSLACAVPIGWWIDRWGARPFLVGGVGLVLGMALLFPLVDTLVLLALGLALLGLGHLMITVGVQTLIATRAGRDGSLSAFGFFTVTVSLGQLAGPLLLGAFGGSGGPTGGASSATGVQVGSVFVAAAVAAGVALVLVLLLSGARATGPVPAVEGDERVGILRSGWRVLRRPNMPTAMFVSLSVLASVDVLIAYLPAYGDSEGLSVQTVGLLLATLGAASLVSRALMATVVRGLGLGRVLVGCAALAAIAVAVFPLLVSLPWALFVAMAVAGFGLGLGQPLTLAWVARTTPVEIRSTALGVRIAGNRLGQVVVPAVVGAVVGVAGPVSVFWALTGMLGASAVTAARGRRNFDD